MTFPYSAVISDLDGTLLHTDHRLHPFTIDTLNRLTAQGVPFVVATGRPFQDVKGIFEPTGLKDLFLVTSNGAVIHRLDGTPVYQNHLPNDIARYLTSLPFDETKVCVSTYEERGWFMNKDIPEVNEFHKDSGFTYAVANFETHAFDKVEKVFFLGKSGEDLKALEEKVNALGDKVHWTYSTPFCLEVMNQNVSKASALSHILGAETLNNAIAFGDGLNDVEMLNFVKKGCVMGNADPRLVEKLPHLEQIQTNGEEAVAHYLLQLMG